MKDKRGQGISMEFIIIAAIALIVLIVIILFFTGGLEKIFGGQKEVLGTVTDQTKEIWRSQCKLYCSLGQKENFQNREFRVEGGTSAYKCSDTTLQVKCENCIGSGSGCSSKKTKPDCDGVAGCVWEAW
jgi:hypothetical protein